MSILDQARKAYAKIKAGEIRPPEVPPCVHQSCELSEKSEISPPAPAMLSHDLPAEWHLFWDERAAIMEYDGGLHREKAEALALFDTLRAMERS